MELVCGRRHGDPVRTVSAAAVHCRPAADPARTQFELARRKGYQIARRAPLRRRRGWIVRWKPRRFTDSISSSSRPRRRLGKRGPRGSREQKHRPSTFPATSKPSPRSCGIFGSYWSELGAACDQRVARNQPEPTTTIELSSPPCRGAVGETTASGHNQGGKRDDEKESGGGTLGDSGRMGTAVLNRLPKARVAVRRVNRHFETKNRVFAPNFPAPSLCTSSHCFHVISSPTFASSWGQPIPWMPRPIRRSCTRSCAARQSTC